MSAAPRESGGSEDSGGSGSAYTNGRYTGYQGVQDVIARMEW